MDLQFGTIRLQMTMYGGLIGAVGGGLLGAGFVALTYNPFFEMNILLVMVGMLATTMVGGFFGLVSGFLSGLGVATITAIWFKQARFRTLHKLLSAGFTVAMTLFVFFHVAYAVGRPFIWDIHTYPSWVWAMVLSVIGALIVSTLAVNSYINQHSVKLKPAYAKVYVEDQR